MFQLIEIKKSRDGIQIERPLKDGTIIFELKKEWENDHEYQYSLQVVRLEHEIIVNFNLYFRMTAGISQTRESFFVTDYTPVGFLTDQIKSHLKIAPNDNRFGLMGNYAGGEKGFRKLSKEEKVINLKNAWENADKTFFQFQVLPEMEDQKHLGADKEGYIDVYNIPTWKKRWASLRGTSLFLFKEKQDHEHFLEIQEIFNCKIVEIGPSKIKGIGQKFPFRFDVDNHNFAVEDQTTAHAWVEALKSSGSRKDARSTNIVAPHAKRTFVAIGSTPPPNPEEKKKNEKTLDELMDEVSKSCQELVQAKANEIVPPTKAVIAASQALCNAASKEMANKKKSLQEKSEKNIASIKENLKNLIPAAKAAGTQGNTENSTENKELIKITKAIIESCETVTFLTRIDEDEDIVIEKKHNQAPLKTGNEELDKIMKGLASFGVAPELDDMMQEASHYQYNEDLFKNSEDTESSFAPVQDDGLTDILANLNSAMEGFDDPIFKPAPVTIDDDSGFRCALCYDAIRGKVLNGINKRWHPHCFYCSQCGSNLENVPPSDVFEGPGGNPYCKKDFLKLCPVCANCSQPVIPAEKFNAFNKVYHKKCFNCYDCKNPINDRGFELENRTFCEMCYHTRQGSLCPECNKPIYGNVINALGKMRHPHCFICCYCKSTLKKETTRASNEKLYCTPCYAKLF